MFRIPEGVCWIVVVLLVIVIIVIYVANRRWTDQYIIRGMVVNVLSDYANKDEAMKIMIECNSRMIRLLDHLRHKYKIGATDEECQRDCAKWIAAHAREREFVRHLLRDFNYEAIHENRPNPGSKSVAYSLNKGRTIMICLRSIDDPRELMDADTLMFVILHEAAHVANYDQWGHETQFWQVFKYMLIEAVDVGVYKPTDYARFPKNYCGFHLNHNPIFDSRITSLVAQ